MRRGLAPAWHPVLIGLRGGPSEPAGCWMNITVATSVSGSIPLGNARTVRLVSRSPGHKTP